MRKIKVKGIWRYIFSDEEKQQVYNEQKQGLSKSEKALLQKLSKPKHNDKNTKTN